VPRLIRAAVLVASLGGVAHAQKAEYTRFVSRAKPKEALHVQSGTLEVGAIPDSAVSADWVVEPADEGYFRIRNRYRNTFIHIEHGVVEAGAIDPEWFSAQWSFIPTGDGHVRIKNRWKPEQFLNTQL